MDYLITAKNDTIFGAIRTELKKEKVLFEKNLNFKKGGVKYYRRKLKNIKQIRFNDDIYIFKKPSDDGIYENNKESFYNDTLNLIKTINDNFYNTKLQLTDYVINFNNDTIYGIIKKPIIGKDYLITKSNSQVKIGKDSIKEYRYLNDIYQYLEKERINVLDNKKAYLKLLLNGKVKLFEYEYHHTNLNQTNANYLQKRTIDPFVDYYYYILKDNELILLRNIGYKKRLIDLFSEMNQLVAKINDDEYTLENIYLIVKYYNDAQ